MAKGDVEAIEKVQKRAIKIVISLKHLSTQTTDGRAMAYSSRSRSRSLKNGKMLFVLIRKFWVWYRREPADEWIRCIRSLGLTRRTSCPVRWMLRLSPGGPKNFMKQGPTGKSPGFPVRHCCWGAYSASLGPLAGFKGHTSKHCMGHPDLGTADPVDTLSMFWDCRGKVQWLQGGNQVWGVLGRWFIPSPSGRVLGRRCTHPRIFYFCR